ncbi:hypothetical protein AcW1_007289 [Taiwanofungus camphoratus]|nr:hypothetical protein AcW2_007643 [Antrodia cinnamomea]KAI0927481.1 hypothetical protein AcV5_008010 [Antrodia cinnamomea]KAI0930773.1 hypothetical protein AcV7_004865 [Antrodia cinnamomea]KAI0952939.1 hypothetical protein AcW1_007289 [Antrodia cinnamomea]
MVLFHCIEALAVCATVASFEGQKIRQRLHCGRELSIVRPAGTYSKHHDGTAGTRHGSEHNNEYIWRTRAAAPDPPLSAYCSEFVKPDADTLYSLGVDLRTDALMTITSQVFCCEYEDSSEGRPIFLLRT